MNIVIVGNPKANGDRIKDIATRLTETGISVRYPTAEMTEIGEDFSMVETFERIDWADFVIVIPKEGLSFNQSTTAELAYAKHRKKPVFIYYE